MDAAMARYQFGPFELDTEAGELRKHGLPIRIQNQPLQVLRALLDRADQVVDREDLRQAVWANDTFVDFEHGLNAAMNKLRRALGDSAESPRYIETLSGRGYRFIGPVKNHHQPVPSESRLEPASIGARLKIPRTSPPRVVWLPGMVVVVSVVFGIWGLLTIRADRHIEIVRPVTQFAIPSPAGTVFAPPISHQPFAISPDGTRLAFTASGPNGTAVWVRELSSLEMHSVPGTDGAWAVFWSLDSRSIFYSVKRILKQANLDTGSTRSVATLPFLAGFGAWRPDGNLLLYLGPQTSYDLQVGTGALRKVTGGDFRLPQVLPHTGRILHVADDPASGRWRAQVTDLAGARSTPLMDTDSRVQYVPSIRRAESGSLLYVRGGTLLVQSFDADRLRLAGQPFPILQDIIFFGPSAQACFSVSDNGVLVYQSGWPNSELKWYDRAGRVVGTVGRPAPYVGSLRISHDGRKVAATVWNPDNGRSDVWLFDLHGSQSRRLTYPPASHYRPVWSPTGQRITFGVSRTGPPRLAMIESEPAGGEQQILNRAPQDQASRLNQIELPTDWSRDGRFIAFDTGLGEEEQEVWLLDTAHGDIVPLLRGEYAQWGSAFSPDGRRIAFVSTESGRPEVYVQGFDGTPSPRVVGKKGQVSKEGGWIERWRPDGRELFYVGLDNWLYAVAAAEGSPLGDPKPLFQIQGNLQYGTTSDFQFEVSADGQRFLMSTTGAVKPPAFTVIEGWQEKFHR
jgi:eukaryotic-like serine/threonine-protein kinase